MRQAIRPAGALAPVFTNPILTPEEIHYGRGAEYAWEQRQRQADPQSGGAHEVPVVENVTPPTAVAVTTLGPAWFQPWLRTSPTVAEINQVLQDFNLRFSRDTGIPQLLTDDGRRYRAQHHLGSVQEGAPTDPLVFFVKAFQLLDRIRFKFTLPIVGDRPYEWVKSLCQQRLFFSISDGPVSDDIHVFAYARPYEVVMSTNSNWDGQGHARREGLLPYSTLSILQLCATIVHECRHTVPGGGKLHDCDVLDSTLAYAGAWAAAYWWLRGCLEYSIEPPIDAYSLARMFELHRYKFCAPIEPPASAVPVRTAPTAVVIPVRPAGDSLLAPARSTPQNPIAALLAQRATVSLSDEQIRQLMQSRRVDDPALQRALSQRFQLPWYIIERSLGTI
jgi:hypothetical protein